MLVFKQKTAYEMRISDWSSDVCSSDLGWKASDAGLLNSAGQPLSFEILLVNPRLERILQPYVENLARIGIQDNLRTVDSAQYKQRLDHYDYDSSEERRLGTEFVRTCIYPWTPYRSNKSLHIIPT